MHLSEVTIKNFKGITEEKFCFRKGFNIIIGDNAVGKTTILEAVSVGLGGFLGGIDGIYSKHFTKDIYLSSRKKGYGKELCWRKLNSGI